MKETKKNETIEKIERHLKENWPKYALGAAGLVGVALGCRTVNKIRSDSVKKFAELTDVAEFTKKGMEVFGNGRADHNIPVSDTLRLMGPADGLKDLWTYKYAGDSKKMIANFTVSNKDQVALLMEEMEKVGANFTTDFGVIFETNVI